jgi:hypothetical protein
MKIVNGKLEFDTVVCWDCRGKKEVTRYNLCPHNYKQVRQFGGKCPCCGAKNKHSHKTVGQRQEPCHICEAKGERVQNAYEMMTVTEWASLLPHFNFTVIRGSRSANFNESYLGIGILYGITDYTDWTTKSNEEALAAATSALTGETTASHPSQPIQFINKETFEVYTDLSIILLRDGWHVMAVKPKA